MALLGRSQLLSGQSKYTMCEPKPIGKINPRCRVQGKNFRPADRNMAKPCAEGPTFSCRLRNERGIELWNQKQSADVFDVATCQWYKQDRCGRQACKGLWNVWTSAQLRTLHAVKIQKLEIPCQSELAPPTLQV